MNTTLNDKWPYFLPRWRIKEKKSLPSIFFSVVTPHIAVLQIGVKYPVLIAIFFFYTMDISEWYTGCLFFPLCAWNQIKWVCESWKQNSVNKNGQMHDSCNIICVLT